MIIRIRYKKLGGHYHCRVFTKHNDSTFAKVGELVFDEKDFHYLQNHNNTIEVLADNLEEVEFLVTTQ